MTISLIVLFGCAADDPKAEDGDVDSATPTSDDSGTTPADECPYDDGGGFYTGGRFAVELSEMAWKEWEDRPTLVGGLGCITLIPDQFAYTWRWLEGSFITWNETHFDFVEDLTLDCRLDGIEYDCSGDSTSTSFEGVEGTPMTVSLGCWGEWGRNDFAAGVIRVSVRCDDYGCDDAARELWGPYDGNGFPIDYEAQTSAELVE